MNNTVSSKAESPNVTSVPDGAAGLGDEARGEATRVPAYVVGLLSDVEAHEELFDYMAVVERSMARFGGRWASHGRTPEVLEGSLGADIVLIRFPDLAAARAWYGSPEYQAVVPLRTRHSAAVVAIVEGVAAGYSTTSTIERMRAALVG